MTDLYFGPCAISYGTQILIGSLELFQAYIQLLDFLSSHREVLGLIVKVHTFNIIGTPVLDAADV
jgi:hypothetical protein